MMRGLRVILEGPDNSGKTTLANGLAYVFNANHKKLTHRNRPETEIAFRSLVTRALMYDDKYHSPIILDRWFYPSDIIYTPIIEGKKSPLEQDTERIEREFNRMHVLFLHVTANLNVLQKRMETDTDTYARPNQLNRIATAYKRFMRRTQVPVCEVDTTSLNPDETLRMAVDLITNFYINSYLNNRRGDYPV